MCSKKESKKIKDPALCQPHSVLQCSPSCFYLLWHPLSFFACGNFILLHLSPCSLCESTALSSHFFNKLSHVIFSCMILCWWLATILSVITFSLPSLCFIFCIIPVLSCYFPSLSSVQFQPTSQPNIVFLFIGWGPLSWYLQQQTCFYNVEIKGVSKTLIVLVVRAKWYGFSLVFKDVITAVRLCFH